jgi:hypothetical protein
MAEAPGAVGLWSPACRGNVRSVELSGSGEPSSSRTRCLRSDSCTLRLSGNVMLNDLQASSVASPVEMPTGLRSQDRLLAS